MKTFAQHSKELEEAPLIQDQIPAVKSMATKIVNLLTKEICNAINQSIKENIIVYL